MRFRHGRRIALALAVAITLTPACRASSYPQMRCSSDARQNLLHLVAQAVPSATILPCIERLRPGWSYGGSEVGSGLVHFWLDSDRVGSDAVDVTLTATCNVSGDVAEPVATGDVRLVMYEEPAAAHPGVTVRHYVATGGCATVRYSFTQGSAPTVYADAQVLLGYDVRSSYVRATRKESGLTLCGAEAPPCPG